MNVKVQTTHVRMVVPVRIPMDLISVSVLLNGQARTVVQVSLNNPCKNGGICQNTYESYICICPPQWTGKDCGAGKS